LDRLNIISIEVMSSRVKEPEPKLTMNDFLVCVGVIFALLYVLGTPGDIPAGLGNLIDSVHLL
jgi:hypothetical protein